MDILNNIATSIGLGSLDSVASNVGLDPIGSLGPLIIGVILLLTSNAQDRKNGQFEVGGAYHAAVLDEQ